MPKNEKLYAVEFSTIKEMQSEIFDTLEEAEIFFDRIPDRKNDTRLEVLMFNFETRLLEVEKVVIRNNSYYVVTDVIKTK